ncbi:hypothetical protein EMIHUDRAFT_65880, partial [Emiliania huxleyi CCMP1516]|uniref:Kinesin-like protein n=2 Tax=Emiliania huxleyi TaxID=2903 RepID=A0A0D3J2Z0_EMIH1
MAHRHAAAHPDPSPDRQHTFVPATTSTIATQINVNDPDDKMGGIDYLRLDKNRDKAYAFDLAFDESISQQDVYEKASATLRHVIDGVLRGTNACCFAYGATGSGKTYTMTGVPGQPGVIPLTVAGLFEAIDASKTRVVVRLQYVEIYNEVVKDLLDPSDKITLDVREDPRQGTFVAGAASLVVGSREAVEDMLARGNQFRTTSATGCNEVSSRSHAVLQLRLETEKEGGAKAIGKLALIDLAGSERATKTDNRGQRLNEGANINRSLLALANCINALVQGGGPGAGRGRGHAHVPYRDSKLTRLLKDSLGGKSTTCIITNVSPASDQFEETINTLKYANRAKNIKT